MKKFHLPLIALNKCNVISHIHFPHTLLFSLSQGTMKDAQVVVSIGDRIGRGDLIAKGTSAHSQYLHSSVGGKIVKIRNFKYPGNYNETRFIEIEFGGHFSSYSKEVRSVDHDFIRTDLISCIQQAGIYDVDIGIVENYLRDKMQHPFISHVIINAVEFSPLLMLEEKILQLHAREISIAVHFILNLYSSGTHIPKCIVNSNIFSNKRNVAQLLKRMGYTTLTNSMSSIGIEDELFSHVHDNIYLTCKSLSRKIEKSVNLRSDQELSMYDIKSQILILRPSTLLAIYEAIIFDKPFIDIYIQLMLGREDISVVRAPLGTPMIYLLSKLNDTWKELPPHCFVGNFIEREILLNMVTPITKKDRHYWFLSDDDFTTLYRRLKAWTMSDTIS